jgi:hypothetical protein
MHSNILSVDEHLENQILEKLPKIENQGSSHLLYSLSTWLVEEYCKNVLEIMSSRLTEA